MNARFARLLLVVNGLVPLTLLLWDLAHHRVGANPLEFATRTTGMLTLVFVFLSLAITPVRHVLGLNALTKVRRVVGLLAFFYGCVHLVTYLWFDRQFRLRSTFQDIISRPFIAVGMFAFVLLLPLALTSSDRMVRRLGGKRWAQVHRLVYLAGAAGVVHYWMLVKSDTRLPSTFAFLLVLLLGHRAFRKLYPPRHDLAAGQMFPRD